MAYNQIGEEEILVIRTLECDLCMRFDSIMITREEIEKRVESNSLQIGSHLISHRDHLRIVYFDRFGIYLGDTISLNTGNNKLENFDRELQIFPKYEQRLIKRIRNKLLKKFLLTKQSICIVGPSFAGKTSLTMYLETGIPERYSKRISHSPTLGKSVRRFRLGKSKLIVFDMGGQRDFWAGWGDSIQYSEKLIFVIDGTANNNKEVIDSLNLVLKERGASKPVLVLNNKMDLFLDGYSTEFSASSDFLSQLDAVDPKYIWMLEVSVFNGICYNYGGKKEETTLADVISDFLEF